MHYLVRYFRELDSGEKFAEGFVCASDDDVEKFKTHLLNLDSRFCLYYMATDEVMWYDNGSELLNDCTFEKISDEEHELLKKMFTSKNHTSPIAFGEAEFFRFDYECD